MLDIEQFDIQNGLNIYLEDMPLNGLYVVQKGSVNEYYFDRKGHKKISCTVKNGEIFGHKDFNSTKHSFSTVALENSSICFINKETIHKTCSKSPDLTIKLLTFFAEELNKSDNRLYSLI